VHDGGAPFAAPRLVLASFRRERRTIERAQHSRGCIIVRTTANASIDARRNDPRIARTIPAMRIERERTSLNYFDPALQLVLRSATRRCIAAASTRRTLTWNMGTAT
jgi:hypothetical protein